ncbi:unnamed protein product [Prunus armeniaca]|uniref:Uncharacterized protein n=1 Tax=Prunus armeniaca TaxID=36596 RepID=A0A6J5XSM1_PRUAR|nr:unnamed protein product [Prunus armeniaca]
MQPGKPDLAVSHSTRQSPYAEKKRKRRTMLPPPATAIGWCSYLAKLSQHCREISATTSQPKLTGPCCEV